MNNILNISFSQFLNEMPRAGIGDWDYLGLNGKTEKQQKEILHQYHMDNVISMTAIYKNWVKLKNYTIYNLEVELYKSNTSDTYMIGSWYFNETKDEQEFISISEGKLIPIKLGILGKGMQMTSIKTHNPDLQGKGFASTIYKYILSTGVKVVSDRTQYDGARKTYTRLSKDPKINAKLYNDYTDIVLDENLDIRVSLDPSDYDESVWSKTNSKNDILIVLSY